MNSEKLRNELLDRQKEVNKKIAYDVLYNEVYYFTLNERRYFSSLSKNEQIQVLTKLLDSAVERGFTIGQKPDKITYFLDNI